MTTNKDALDVSKLLEDLDYVLDKHGAYNHGEENEFFHLNVYERVKNALQTQAELVECLKWYVENDDTNEGDATENGGKNWDIENAYYIDGRNRAIETLARAEGRE